MLKQPVLNVVSFPNEIQPIWIGFEAHYGLYSLQTNVQASWKAKLPHVLSSSLELPPDRDQPP